MITTYISQQSEQIATILKAAGKLSTSDTASIRAFFTHAPLADVQLLSPKESYRVAADALAFAHTRPGNDTLISITTDKKSSRLTIRVLGDDMPFLVDSLSMLMHTLGIKIDLTLHPILAVTRDAKGTLKSATAADESPSNHPHESLIVMLATGLPDGLDTATLDARIRDVLRKVRAAVNDWKRMSKSAFALAEPFETRLPGIHNNDAREIGDFLRWLADKNFVFLGLGEYSYTASPNPILSLDGRVESPSDSERVKTSPSRGRTTPLSPNPLPQGQREQTLTLTTKTALGLYTLPVRDSISDGACPIEYRLTPSTARFIEITKSSEPCEVHRAVPMDMIVVKRFDAKGSIIGETRILGLFTSNVYYQITDAIPLIRRKVAHTLERSAFDPISHNGKSLKAILEFLPRDELFQLSEEALFALGMGILSLESRPKVRVFTRIDAFERYASCIVYVPRERFSTTVREQIERVLARAYHGSVITFYTQVSDSPLARVNILIATVPGTIPSVDTDALEHEITELTNVWSDALLAAAINSFGQSDGTSIALAYAGAFDTAYVTAHTASSAISDITRIREALSRDGLALELFTRPLESEHIHLKCYTTDTASTLSDVVPMLENMGTKLVEVHPYLVRPKDLPPILIRDFVLRLPTGITFDIDAHKARLESALGSIWRDTFADDALNGLLFKTALTAREIDILRVFTRYMRQINFAYGQMVIWRALNTHAAIASALVTYFDARFNPATSARDKAMESARTHLITQLESVNTLAEDRILRRILELMEATTRTNAYQALEPSPSGEGRVREATTPTTTAHKPYLSIKLLSRSIPELPLPKPYAEIFVYSMETEGVHLRGDTVARGGLRWSDRPEDFRTEVLGLMKAQMVKNAVIVPSGSKGGFILKHTPTDRTALQNEAIRCYKIFLSGLLDLTDNIVGSKLMPPRQVVRHDGDDPYLVVAADKGTATFSDIANAVSADYGFWLGDAFASGGSAGYDHKTMAITARGAWISVQRHFREMEHDISKEHFTCVGIGDMSGDVFGNGMLLSDTIHLVAAFNHKHIFLDPTPDAKTSFTERTRLFALARSGWNDYDITKISKGGGVFERSVKSIALSKEAQAALGTDAKSASPDELIQIILRAPVHLLWNGGIGTYVKSENETHDEVGDRTNNAVRINGADLRCKIVGEGGNLGFTQLGRIEYARLGGRINTDAIDNSAGVDCSDHEVNIKIALGRAVEEKRLTIAKRNSLLKAMEKEVAQLVLEDNRLQTQALSIAEAMSAQLLEPLTQLMQDLERQNFLNREVEFLPAGKDIAELRAQNLGLTRPELAVLLAYSKLALTRDLKGSTRLDDPQFTPDLLRYFPKPMQKNYADDIAGHRLRREIVATVLTNEIINRLGIVSVHHAMHETGATAQTIVDAYVFVRDVFDIDALWHGVEALDGKVSPALQLELFATIRSFANAQLRSVAHTMPTPLPFKPAIAQHRAHVATLRTHWRDILTPSRTNARIADITRYVASGAPEPLAEQIVVLGMLASSGIIIAATGGKKHTIAHVAAMYFALEHALGIDRIATGIAHLPQANSWQRQAAATASSQIVALQQRILTSILAHEGDKPDAAARWLRTRDDAFTRYERLMSSLPPTDPIDTAMIFVALRELELLAG